MRSRAPITRSLVIAVAGAVMLLSLPALAGADDQAETGSAESAVPVPEVTNPNGNHFNGEFSVDGQDASAPSAPTARRRLPLNTPSASMGNAPASSSTTHQP